MKSLKFFAKDGKGLTSTSANTIANFSKEYVKRLNEKLDNISFINKKIGLITGDAEKVVAIGNTQKDLEELEGILRDIAKAKSLSSWLREAIKAKAELELALKSVSDEEFSKESGVEIPDMEETPEINYPEGYKDEDEPESPLQLKKEDVILTKSPEWQQKYYELEDLAAVFGSIVHDGMNQGSFSKARKELGKIIQNPISVSENGSDTVITYYEPSVDSDIVENYYFKFQQEHRKFQKELNSMKSEVEKKVVESNIKSLSEYQKKSKDYQDVRSKFRKEHSELVLETRERYRIACKDFNNKKDLWTKEKLKELGELKIFIPENLEEIYKKISELGK